MGFWAERAYGKGMGTRHEFLGEGQLPPQLPESEHGRVLHIYCSELVITVNTISPFISPMYRPNIHSSSLLQLFILSVQVIEESVAQQTHVQGLTCFSEVPYLKYHLLLFIRHYTN